VPLILSGAALTLWAANPAYWRKCADYRFAAALVSLPFMIGASFEAMWPASAAETSLRGARSDALRTAGAIFLLVLSIQSLQWERMSQRLANELVNSGRGCVPLSSLPWIQGTAMDHWGVIVYAADLQGKRPRTLLLPHDQACRTFALTGDALLADSGRFQPIRHRDECWFDFDESRSRTQRPGN
jgi:hypothetical protein